jgi:hypothetical protein
MASSGIETPVGLFGLGKHDARSARLRPALLSGKNRSGDTDGPPADDLGVEPKIQPFRMTLPARRRPTSAGRRW